MKDSFDDHKKAQHLVQKLSFWWLPLSTNFNSKTEEYHQKVTLSLICDSQAVGP